MVFVTLIPLRHGKRTGGAAVTQAEFRNILDGVFDRFGGYTLGTMTEGKWRDDRTGEVEQDACRELKVVCGNERYNDAVEEVRAIGRRLGQIEMYFEVRDFEGVTMLRVE